MIGPALLSDFDEIVLRPDAAEHVLGLGSRLSMVDQNLVYYGGITMRVGDDVVAMAGVLPFSDHSCELWMRTGVLADKHWLALARAGKRWVRRIWSEKQNVKRLQVTVRHDIRVNVRFARWLGFEVEGLLRRYGPDGSDHFMMSMTRR